MRSNLFQKYSPVLAIALLVVFSGCMESEVSVKDPAVTSTTSGEPKEGCCDKCSGETAETAACCGECSKGTEVAETSCCKKCESKTDEGSLVSTESKKACEYCEEGKACQECAKQDTAVKTENQEN